MKIVEFLVDNWWILLAGYAIWRSLTKKSAAMREQAKRVEEARAQTRPIVRQAEPVQYFMPTESADASEDINEDARTYTFSSPVEKEEIADEKERLAAFQFVEAERVTAGARRAAAKAESTELDSRPYMPFVTTVPGGATWGMTFTADDMRRAFILSEIILPPRSKRRVR